MKWTKLEYGKWPEGEIVMRIKEPKGQIWYQVGIISQHLKNKEWYFYLSYALTSKVSIDSIYDTEPHYIELDLIKLPENEDE